VKSVFIERTMADRKLRAAEDCERQARNYRSEGDTDRAIRQEGYAQHLRERAQCHLNVLAALAKNKPQGE